MILPRRKTLPMLAPWSALPAAAAGAVAETDIPLWPGMPPGGGRQRAPPERIGSRGQIADAHRPPLILHRPAKPNGWAMVVAGGGGYRRIALARESGPAGQRAGRMARALRHMDGAAGIVPGRAPAVAGARFPDQAAVADGLISVVASLFSSMSAFFSSARVCSSSETTSLCPASLAQATSEP